MSFHHFLKGQCLRSPSGRGPATEPSSSSNSGAGGSVTSVYQTRIAGSWRNVTIQWSKSHANISFSVTVEGAGEGERAPHTCKLEVKPWSFWSKKGYKLFEVDDDRHLLEVYWDLRSAKFPGDGAPEPLFGYYLALVSGEEIVLLVGDLKKKAYKRTKKRSTLVNSVQTLKRQTVYGKSWFATRAKWLEEEEEEHEVVVENSDDPPEMWISVDGVEVVRANNLRWKFRGSETVKVNHVPVHVLWDVHKWLYGRRTGGGCGLFVFKPGAPEGAVSVSEGDDVEGISVADDGERDDVGGWGIAGGVEATRTYDFCLVLNACKID